jgi:2-oxoisovalerate dehydrogenase E1 component alpha subunit
MEIIAQFSIQFLRILDEAGNINSNYESPVSAAELIKLYEVMQTIRIFDNKAIQLQRTGKMGTYAPIHGQEAIGAAIGFVMKPEDVFIPYYRDYAVQMQRGTKLCEILSFWGGDESGNNYANNHDLPMCVPIASQCLHAAGIAFAFKYRNDPKVAVVTIGDGGTSEGDFYEALNIAGAWKLPVVFVINNNKWAISVPISEQTAAETLAQKAIAAGFEGIQVDGNDILGLISVLKSSVSKARNGAGPTLIEAVTYRLSDHTTADDAKRYQPPEEVKHAKNRDPLLRIKTYLEHNHQWDAEKEAAIIHKANNIVDDAIHEYLQIQSFNPQDVFQYHYANFPYYLYEQQAEFLEDVANG